MAKAFKLASISPTRAAVWKDATPNPIAAAEASPSPVATLLPMPTARPPAADSPLDIAELMPLAASWPAPAAAPVMSPRSDFVSAVTGIVS